MKIRSNIFLKPKAYVDLENIYNYSYYKFGQLIAIKYVEYINKAFVKISESPEILQN